MSSNNSFNFKGKLLEYQARNRHLKIPVFDTKETRDASSSGPTSPLPVFTCSVTIEGVPFVATGISIKKKEAENEAARKMLVHLARDDPNLSGITMPESWKSIVEESNRSLNETPPRSQTNQQSASSVLSTPVRPFREGEDSQQLPSGAWSMSDMRRSLNEILSMPQAGQPASSVPSTPIRSTRREPVDSQEVYTNGIHIFENDPLDALNRVFRGSFDGRDVAVKRVQKEKNFVREVEALRKLNHRYIVRYLGSGSGNNENWLYIAVELCAGTLEGYLTGEIGSEITKKEILHQVVKGMDYIHSARIVHRDIKPSNILISKPDFRNRVYAKIADFGLAKNVKGEVGDFSQSSSGIIGTIDWIAPELLHEKPEGASWKVDVFSLGSVFYYTFSERRKPFNYNFIEGKWIMEPRVHSSDELQGVEEEGKALIQAMIAADPDKRPSMSAVLRHPFFWLPKKKIEFLLDVSDYLYGQRKKVSPDPVGEKLEERFDETVGKNWLHRLRDDCEVLWQEFVKPQKNNTIKEYMNGMTIVDLLRAIRNTKHHLREKTEELLAAVGSKPVEYYTFWNSRYPKLLLHTWEVFEECKDEEGFEDYYCNSFTFSR